MRARIPQICVRFPLNLALWVDRRGRACHNVASEIVGRALLARPHVNRIKDVLQVVGIVIAPDPLLRQVCEPCTPGDHSLKKLAQADGASYVQQQRLRGCSSQVGVTKRLVVIDVGDSNEPPITFGQPEILELKGEPETQGRGLPVLSRHHRSVSTQALGPRSLLRPTFERLEIEGDGFSDIFRLQHETII